MALTSINSSARIHNSHPFLFAYFTWFYNRLLLHSTELRNTKLLYFHAWYLMPRLSDLAPLAKRRVHRQVGQSFRCEEKRYDFGSQFTKHVSWVRSSRVESIYCFQFEQGMCFAMRVIHLVAKINQLTSRVFLSAMKSAMTTAMILIQVFSKPKGNTFLLVVCSVSGHETVCFIASR